MNRPGKQLDYVPEPPRWAKPVAGVLVVVVYSLAMVGLGKLTEYRAMIHADEDVAQAEIDRAVADSLTAGCMSKATADRLLFDAIYAAHYTHSTQEVVREFLGWVPVERGARVVGRVEP